MTETEFGVNIPGIGGGNYKKITSFPTKITDSEKLVDKLELKKSIKYVTFETDKDGKLIARVLLSIPKKE